MLDYATGAGWPGSPRSDVATVEAADELPDLLEEGERLAAELGLVNVAFTLVDLYALPYKDGAFDSSSSAATRSTCCPIRRRRWPSCSASCRPGAASSCWTPSWTRRPTRRSTSSPGCASRRTAVTTGVEELEDIVAHAGFAVRQRRDLRRTIDLDYWLQAAAVPPPKADLIRGRIKALPVDVQTSMDVAFSDRP